MSLGLGALKNPIREKATRPRLEKYVQRLGCETTVVSYSIVRRKSLNKLPAKRMCANRRLYDASASCFDRVHTGLEGYKLSKIGDKLT